MGINQNNYTLVFMDIDSEEQIYTATSIMVPAVADEVLINTINNDNTYWNIDTQKTFLKVISRKFEYRDTFHIKGGSNSQNIVYLYCKIISEIKE